MKKHRFLSYYSYSVMSQMAMHCPFLRKNEQKRERSNSLLRLTTTRTPHSHDNMFLLQAVLQPLTDKSTRSMHYEAESPFAGVRGSGVDEPSFQTQPWLCGPHYHHLHTCCCLTACLSVGVTDLVAAQRMKRKCF